MVKKKPQVTVHSYGRYDGWDRESRALPKLLKMTSEIEAAPGVEFGYILRIQNARNARITFRIEHPPFKDSAGHVVPPFTGELYVKTNDYRFFLGDSVWLPVEDKRGPWRLITWLDDQPAADRTLQLV